MKLRKLWHYLADDGPNNEHWNFDIDGSSVRKVEAVEAGAVTTVTETADSTQIQSERWMHSLKIER